VAYVILEEIHPPGLRPGETQDHNLEGLKIMVARERTETEANVTETKAPLSAADAIAAAAKAQKSSLAGATEGQVNERGFTRVFDKDSLIGKAFTIVDWDMTPGEYGMMYDVNIVRGNRALWFRDGGTGVPAQLLKLADGGVREMISCPKGLRKSVYPNPHGEGMSTTYYLDENEI